MKYNLIGNVYGKLKVVELAPREMWKGRNQFWVCKCECGITKIIRGAHLTGGLTKSCGCLLKRTTNDHPLWTGYGEISKTFFSQIVIHAKERNIPCIVTIEQIWDLFIKQNRKCALSGIDLTFQPCGRSREGTASLDRIDSTKPYSIDNIQWVHKYINLMKWDLTTDEFKFFCKKVTEYENKAQ